MHYLHLIAVEADDAEEAVAEAESFLSGYEGEIYDWYEVGGRWSGVLAGDDTLCAAEDPAGFLTAVDEAVEGRNDTVRDLRSHLSGPRPGAALVDPFGFVDPGNAVQVAEVRARTDEMYRDSAALFQELLDTDDIGAERFELLGYRLMKLGRLVAGYYDVESRFFDASYGTAHREQLRQRVLEDPARQWLVAVDMHM